MDNQGQEADRDVLRGVIAAAKGRLDVAPLYAQTKVSNALIRLLDALGLDGHWFSFGPYRGWFLGTTKDHWTVLEWNETRKAYGLANTAQGFLEALQLVVDGKTDELTKLWKKMSEIPVE